MFNKKEITRIGILLLLFGVLAFMVADDKGGVLFDIPILEALHKGSNSFLMAFSNVLAFLGSGKTIVACVGIATVLLVIKKKYYVTKILLAGSAGSYILNFIFKTIIKRTRPLEFMRATQGGYSFPSGHSMVTMSLFLTLAFLITRNKKFENKKGLIYGAAIIYILLMGFSRLYLGVHWPTDVLAGYILGYVVYFVSTKVIQED